MLFRVALCVVMVGAGPAAAQVYTWTDAEGVQHYTDDRRLVPRDAKARTTEGAHVNVVSTNAEKAQPAAPSAPTGADVQAAAAQVQAAAAAQVQAALRNEEDTWRRRFREARERILELEDEIEVDRRRVEEVDGLPLGAGWTCPVGFALPYPPALRPPVAGAGVAVGGQVAPGWTVGMGAGAAWSPGWTWPSVVTTPCWYGFSPEYEKARDRLARNRKALSRAKEALADLERRAAFEAVPLEWRR